MGFFIVNTVQKMTGKYSEKPQNGQQSEYGKFKLKEVVKLHLRKLLTTTQNCKASIQSRSRSRTCQIPCSEQSVSLLGVHKINEDGDRLPDEETLGQVRKFVANQHRLSFVLDKIRYHRQNREMLNRRTNLINEMNRTPATKEMLREKNTLEKGIGGCFRELNAEHLACFIQKARELLPGADEQEAIKQKISAGKP